jgi:hypothetical protein
VADYLNWRAVFARNEPARDRRGHQSLVAGSQLLLPYLLIPTTRHLPGTSVLAGRVKPNADDCLAD